MSNANYSDFKARESSARQRRNARLAKARYEQVRVRSVFGNDHPRFADTEPYVRSAEYVEGFEPSYEGERQP